MSRYGWIVLLHVCETSGCYDNYLNKTEGLPLPGLRFMQRLTPYNVSVRPWVSSEVKLDSGHAPVASYILFLSDF